MKKSLLALAVLGAFAGAAQAQSSVTVYGSFDAGIRNLSNVNAAGDSRLTMNSAGTYNSNRIGFKGVEDLGGGMNAHFTLETGYFTGTGALAGNLFGRSAYVGLGGSWGSVDFGHQYSANFKTIALYDPFNYKYTGIIPLATQGGLTRLSNNIQYTGSFGPLTARAEWALGEQAGSTGDGSHQAVSLGYKGGPLTVGAAYTQGERAVGTAFMDNTNWTIGASYVAAPFRVAAGYAINSQENGAGLADTDVDNIWLGGSFNLSPAAALSLAYYRTETEVGAVTGRRNLVILGATYALSKRTNFYADIDNSRLSGSMISATGQTRQTGISLGINHFF